MPNLSEIKDTQWESIDSRQLSDLEAALLKKQLPYVWANSPFYQKKYATHFSTHEQIGNGFDQLPFTTRQEILEDQALEPPFGTNLCVSPEKLSRVHQTSGTSSRPLIIGLTPDDIQSTLAAGSRSFWASGLRPHHTVIHCLNYCLWMGGYTDHASLEATGALVIPFGVGHSRLLIRAIQNLKVNVIHCTPSYLAKLEALLEEESLNPKDLGLKLGLFGAEGGLENTQFRSRTESVWGIKAMNANYGMAEALSMFGAECVCQEGLHFMGQGCVKVQVIDPKSLEKLPIENGVMGELVLTHLTKQAQPLIKYRTGDMLQILNEGACKCGRKSFRFLVTGRRDDMIVVKGVNVYPSAIRNRLSLYLDKLTGAFQLFVEETRPIHQVTLKIEHLEFLNENEKKNLTQMLFKDLQTHLTISPQIELVPEGTLPRTDGKSQLVVTA